MMTANVRLRGNDGRPGRLLRARLLLPLQALLLAAAIAGWWSQRGETLFSNGRWVVGKDTGKYVFYAHAFLFQPVKAGRVDLTSCMGFQEILYVRAEDENRRLVSLRCDASIDPKAYLWLEARKQGRSLLGCRFSNRKDYPSGFYRYNDSGEISAQEPCSIDMPAPRDGHLGIEMRLKDGQWDAMVQGMPFASIADIGTKGGQFGFRGSGWDHRPVTIGNIEMEFEDPAHPGRHWTERENFQRAPIFRRIFPFAMLFATLAVAMRRWRQTLLSAWISAKSLPSFMSIDDILFTLTMLITVVAQKYLRWPSGIMIPLGIMAAEVLTVAVFVAFQKQRLPDERPRHTSLLVFSMGVILTLVGVAAFLVHGHRNIGGGSDAAYTVQPDAHHASSAFRTNALSVNPGRPFFIENMAYAGQVISASIALASNATLDVVFQQQSEYSRGDPDGEALPLRRRLLRLSTRSDVTTGLSRSTDNRPQPFTPIAGLLEPSHTNRLVLRCDNHGTQVILNGATTLASTLRPLGYGETGFMTYDGGAILDSISVEPISGSETSSSVLPLAAALAPIILACLAWIVFRRCGTMSFMDAARISFAAIYPLAFCLLASLFVDVNTMAGLGRARTAWLNLALSATAVSCITATAAFRPSRKFAVVYANAMILLSIAAGAACIWELLPASHPLRLKFTREAIDPGDLSAIRTDAPGPWYNSNDKIGVHIYPWNQRLGGRLLPLSKKEGTFRIFVTGGSQAWGAGAADSAHTFAQMLEDSLRARGLPVEAFNASCNGGGISRSFFFYRDILRLWQPDLIIADIGLNETSGLVRVYDDERRRCIDSVAKDFEAWLSLCRSDNVEFLLVLEPMCGETPLQPIPAFYDALETVARRNGASVFKPAGKVYEMERNHIIWWDTAHFTPYGHDLFARLLLPCVEQIVQSHTVERTDPLKY